MHKMILLNGTPIQTRVQDYAALRAERGLAADLLLVGGHSRPWQTAVVEGDEALFIDSRKPLTPTLWRMIYDARYGRVLMNKLQAGHVAICGLGGLGSLVALELGRLGVGSLLLIDGDRVDPTNLARQHYTLDQVGQYKTDALAKTLAACAPLTTVRTECTWLNRTNCTSLLSDWPIVCECLDQPETKAILTSTVLSELPEVVLVAASGMAGYGSGNAITTRCLMPRLYLTGDGESAGEDGIGLMAPRVGLCASAQATMVLRLLAGETTP